MDLNLSKNFLDIESVITYKTFDEDFHNNVLNFCRKNLTLINNTMLKGISGSGDVKEFKSKIYLSGDDVSIADDDDNSCLHIILMYLKYGFPDYEKFSSYPPENLFVYFNDIVKSEIIKYRDKTVTDFCKDNPNFGVNISFEEIERSYPDENDLNKLIMFKISNSLNKITPISEISKGELSTFNLKPEETKSSVKIISNKILQKAENCVDAYFEIELDDFKTKLYDSMMCYAVLVNGLLAEKIGDDFRKQPIILGAIYKVLSDYESKPLNFNNQIEFRKTFFALYLDMIEKLFAINIDTSLESILKIKEIQPSDKLTHPVTKYLMLESLKNGVKPSSTIHKLSDDDDRILMKIFSNFFEERYNIHDENFVECIVLLFFAFLSTSKNIRLRNETFNTSFEMDNRVYNMVIQSKDFLNFIDGNVKSLSDNGRKRNYLRLFCSKRANYAIRLFQKLGYVPRMFDKCPKIEDHLRIDFWKGLDMKSLTRTEQMSVDMLRRLTEYHSRRDEISKYNYYEALNLL